MKRKLAAEYGEEKVERAWNRAGRYLERLWEKYEAIPRGEKWHAYNNILPRIALYRALEREFPGKAMGMMDAAVEDAATRAGKMLGAVTALPLMPEVFLRVFGYMTKKLFGPSCGFEQTFYQEDKKELRFDMTKCPYCKYCKKCGCTELTHTFCDSDIYCYGNLPGIGFSRTQTLGTGGACCDFSLWAKR